MKIDSEIDIRKDNSRRKISILYVDRDAELNEALFDSVSVIAYIKRVKKDIIPDVLQKLNLPENTRVNWSQYAGCACGCSPAFLIHDGYALNYSVQIKLDEKDPEFANIL